MSDTLINITCCYNPAQGSPKSREHLAGADLAAWIECAVEHYRHRYDFPVSVSITGFPGLVMTTGGDERDAFYRLFAKCWFLAVPVNPSHQLGAALTLKMGMEFAASQQFEYLVNTAEDVIPRTGSLEKKVEAIRSGYDFVGGIGELDLPKMPADQHQWIRQAGPKLIGAGCQLFACRVSKFAFSWDAGIVKDCIEIHMGNFISRLRHLSLPEEYEHTHDYLQYRIYEERFRDL